MIPGGSIHQLCGNSYPYAHFAYAAFYYVPDSQLATDVCGLDCFPLVEKDRIAGDDKQARELGEVGDEVFSNAIAKILLLGVATQVGKGQDGDRRFVGQGQP